MRLAKLGGARTDTAIMWPPLSGLIMVHVLTETAPELLKPAPRSWYRHAAHQYPPRYPRRLATRPALSSSKMNSGKIWPDLRRRHCPAANRTIPSGRMMRFQIGRARAYYYAMAEPGIAATCPADGSRFCARKTDVATVYWCNPRAKSSGLAIRSITRQGTGFAAPANFGSLSRPAAASVEIRKLKGPAESSALAILAPTAWRCALE